MKQPFYYGALPLLAMAALTGCIDDKYDLSDIDTTTALKVKDLILPINVEPITLGDVITLNQGERIEVVNIDGQDVYAVRESGGISSSTPVIDEFKSPKPEVMDHIIHLSLGGQQLPAGASVSVALDKETQRITYKAENLDDAIESISEIFMSATQFKLIFHLDNIPGAEVALTDVKLQLPIGMHLVNPIVPNGSYDAETGKCEISSVPVVNGTGEIILEMDAINLTYPAYADAMDAAAHTLTIDTNIDIEEANLTIKALNAVTLSSTADLTVEYSVPELNINGVSGYVNYAIENLSVNRVDLTNVPDVVSQPGTNLALGNPQIFVNLNNPVAAYNLNYNVGVKLTAERTGEPDKSYELNNGWFEVKHDKGVAGPYNFCLSPKEVTSFPTGYEGAKWEPFSTLGDVLSGEGLPQYITITLPNTRIYSQYVDHFVLGRDNSLEAIDGRWEFLAPLALANTPGNVGTIIYTKTQDGWNDEDVDAIEITTLELSAIADSTLPVDAVLSGWPVDVNGNKINGAEFEPLTVPAGATSDPITLKLKGTVTHLDGITYKVEVKGAKDNSLSPNQTLSLKNIKVKVSGNYTKEL